MGRGASAAQKVLTEWRGEYKRIAGTIGLDVLKVDYPTERLHRIYRDATLQMRWAQIATIEKGFDLILEALKHRR